MAQMSLEETIDAYSGDLSAQFNTARNTLRSLPAAGRSEDPDQVRTRLQGDVASALAQLASAEAMRATQRGREGYEQVVALMRTTSTTAEAICSRIRFLIKQSPPPTDLSAQIFVLISALQAVAQIAPTAVWEPPTKQATTA
jgi:hypothetical protein